MSFCIGLVSILLLAASTALSRDPLGTPGRSFTSSDRTVGAYVFHWYTPTDGQTHGVWKPREGRLKWDGSVDFWRRQLKDVMDANIDIIYVHLIDRFEPQRVNLFEALGRLRAEGYDPPAVVPFLDPAVTFHGLPEHQPPVDMTVRADCLRLVEQYVRFFTQYASVNRDPHAVSYVGTMDGRIMLDIWSVAPPHVLRKEALQRGQVEAYLRHRLGDHFAAGVFMSSLIPDDAGLAWSDERHRSFVGYTGAHFLKDRNVVALKPGHYDTLDRFLPRNGGAGYAAAWDEIIADPALTRVLIESWNGYTEGTGMYEVDNLKADLRDPRYKPHQDTWGPHPRTYIDITAEKAARFNTVPDLDARFLFHDLPKYMEPGARAAVRCVVRNQGDTAWTAAAGFHLRQENSDKYFFHPEPLRLDDSKNEIPRYGGVFRGRPVSFAFQIRAPQSPGAIRTRWRMHGPDGNPFGETLEWDFFVFPSTGP